MHSGVNFASIAPLVDQVGVMNYDYTGPWSKTTGFLAPLFSNPTDPHHPSNIERNISDYIAAGIPAQKLLMGVPFYGYGWTEVDHTNNGLYQSGRAVHGDQPYRYIRTLIENSSVYRDPRSQAPWLYDGQNFWTYEDAVSVRYKVSYAANQHLGGVMIWELSEDTADAVLLNTAHSALLHPTPEAAFATPADEPVQPTSPGVAGGR
jgi:chitinase